MEAYTEERLHELIIEKKITNRLSYSKIADVIGYSRTGIDKAIKNKTLKLQQIKMIAVQFGFIEEFNKITGDKSDEMPNVENKVYSAMAIEVIENWSNLMDVPVFKNFYYSQLTKTLNMDIDEIFQKALNQKKA